MRRPKFRAARQVVRNTRLFFLETPANPLLEIVDIAGVCEIARQIGYGSKS